MCMHETINLLRPYFLAQIIFTITIIIKLIAKIYNYFFV